MNRSNSRTRSLNAFTLVELLVVMAILALLAARLLPVISRAKPKPRICDVLGTYVGKVGAGTTSVPVFRCPEDNLGRYATEGSSYERNTELNGHRLDETSQQNLSFKIIVKGDTGTQETNGTVQLMFPPVTTPLLLDYDDFHPGSRPSGKNVVFMDDHVSALEPPDLPGQ